MPFPPLFRACVNVLINVVKGWPSRLMVEGLYGSIAMDPLQAELRRLREGL